MEKLLINTPQNVKIEYNLADSGTRIFAFLIDFFIIIISYIIFFSILEYLNIFNTTDNWWNLGWTSLFSLPFLFYPFLCEVIFGGQTIGKKLLKIKVVKLDGTSPDFYEYFVRWIFLSVDFMILFGFVGFISMIISKYNQKLGDLAANTTVISLKSNVKFSHTIFEQIKDEYIPMFDLVVKLSDNDVNIIKKHYQIALKENNYSLMLELSRKITEVTSINKENMNAGDFVNQILKDHYYYHKTN